MKINLMISIEKYVLNIGDKFLRLISITSANQYESSGLSLFKAARYELFFQNNNR